MFMGGYNGGISGKYHPTRKIISGIISIPEEI
jgi:hypothetical protein